MAQLLITYHLTASLEHYDFFFDTIANIEPNQSIELFDGCQLVTTLLTARAVRDRLIPYLNPNDKLFVCEFRHNACAGQLPKLKKKWIKENIMDKAPIDPRLNPANKNNPILEQLRK